LLPRRISRQDEHSAFTDSEKHLILAAETLRSGHGGKPVKPDHQPEEKLSLFWRVFGGTILSICALTIITAYQQLAGGIHDLRTDVGRLREVAGEYLKKDEYNARSTQMWNRLNELNGLNASISVLTNKVAAIEEQRKVGEQDHKDLLAVAVTLAALKDRDNALEKQIKDAEGERREVIRELQQLRERLAKLEGQAENKPAPKSPTPAKAGD
jgi:hypothetical protein